MLRKGFFWDSIRTLIFSEISDYNIIENFMVPYFNPSPCNMNSNST